MSKHIPLVIGTHTWTPDNDEEVGRILEVMRKHQLGNLDTAKLYGPSESVLGRRGLASEFTVDTKAPTGLSEGSGRNIVLSANESLEALQTTKVRAYFLHAPDETTPVGEQMEAIQTLFKQGVFEIFGLSNFTKDQVLEYYNYAKSKGYVLPTMYQCSYSIAVRLNETELFPTLRELGISIQAYSPMAGGLLAKTPEYIEEGKGNWDPQTMTGKLFLDLYGKPSYMNMLRELDSLSKTSGISRTGLAYRWVRYHSALTSNLGDEMILGSVTAEQLEQALAELENGPLPEWVVRRIDGLWEGIRDDSPRNNLQSIRKVLSGNDVDSKI